MDKQFVSEKSFRRRTGYSGDWDRIEPFNRVVLDLELVPFLGEKNVNFIHDLISTSSFTNMQQQQMVDKYIIDITTQYMAYYASTFLYTHFNNAGATTPGLNPSTQTGVKLLKDYYNNAAEALKVQLEKFYCKHSDVLGLPQCIGGVVGHAPFAGLGLNIDLNTNPIEQEFVEVPFIDIDQSFYYGVIPEGDTLTLEIILAGTKVDPQTVVSFTPANGETDHVWFASERTDYNTWRTSSSIYNAAELATANGLFGRSTINELTVHRQNYLSQIDPFILTIQT